jgi:hypothetical protein
VQAGVSPKMALNCLASPSQYVCNPAGWQFGILEIVISFALIEEKRQEA